MKHTNYSFSESDIKAILFGFEVLPSLGLENTEAQSAINYQCSCSAAEKLIKHNPDISANEFRIILASIHALYLINQGAFEVDPETKKECSQYLFTVNNLFSVFEEQLS